MVELRGMALCFHETGMKRSNYFAVIRIGFTYQPPAFGENTVWVRKETSEEGIIAVLADEECGGGGAVHPNDS